MNSEEINNQAGQQQSKRSNKREFYATKTADLPFLHVQPNQKFRRFLPESARSAVVDRLHNNGLQPLSLGSHSTRDLNPVESGPEHSATARLHHEKQLLQLQQARLAVLTEKLKNESSSSASKPSNP